MNLAAYRDLPADLLRHHFGKIVLAGLAAWVGAEAFGLPLPTFGIPLWVRVGLVFGGFAVLGGYLAGSWVVDQMDPDWHYLAAVNFDGADEDDVHPEVQLYRMTEAVVEDMDVVGGRLRSLNDTAADIYVARYYNPEENLAHVTWTGVPSDAGLLGMQPSDVEDEIVGVRESYETVIRKARHVQTHLPMLVRRIDHRRAERQNAALMGESGTDDYPSTDEIIDDVIPDEIQPDRFAERMKTAADDEAEATDPEDVTPDEMAGDGRHPDRAEAEPEIETDDQQPALPTDDD